MDAGIEEIRESLKNTLRCMAPGGNWIALACFLDKSREDIWMDVLHEWNAPLMKMHGVTPIRQNPKKIDYYDLSKRTGTTRRNT